MSAFPIAPINEKARRSRIIGLLGHLAPSLNTPHTGQREIISGGLGALVLVQAVIRTLPSLTDLSI